MKNQMSREGMCKKIYIIGVHKHQKPISKPISKTRPNPCEFWDFLDGFFHLGQVLLNPKTHAKNSFLLMKDFTIPTSPPPHTKIASQPLALTTTNLFQTPLIAYGHLLSIFLSLFHSTI
jgi:hypothetical protein